MPQGYDVGEIDISTVRMSLNGDAVQAETAPSEIGDNDADGIPDLTIKFKREAVYQILSVGEVELAVSGSMTSGLDFSGKKMVTVKDVGKEHLN